MRNLDLLYFLFLCLLSGILFLLPRTRHADSPRVLAWKIAPLGCAGSMLIFLLLLQGTYWILESRDWKIEWILLLIPIAFFIVSLAKQIMKKAAEKLLYPAGHPSGPFETGKDSEAQECPPESSGSPVLPSPGENVPEGNGSRAAHPALSQETLASESEAVPSESEKEAVTAAGSEAGNSDMENGSETESGSENENKNENKNEILSGEAPLPPCEPGLRELQLRISRCYTLLTLLYLCLAGILIGEILPAVCGSDSFLWEETEISGADFPGHTQILFRQKQTCPFLAEKLYQLKVRRKAGWNETGKQGKQGKQGNPPAVNPEKAEGEEILLPLHASERGRTVVNVYYYPGDGKNLSPLLIFHERSGNSVYHLKEGKSFRMLSKRDEKEHPDLPFRDLFLPGKRLYLAENQDQEIIVNPKQPSGAPGSASSGGSVRGTAPKPPAPRVLDITSWKIQDKLKYLGWIDGAKFLPVAEHPLEIPLLERVEFLSKRIKKNEP